MTEGEMRVPRLNCQDCGLQFKEMPDVGTGAWRGQCPRCSSRNTKDESPQLSQGQGPPGPPNPPETDERMVG